MYDRLQQHNPTLIDPGGRRQAGVAAIIRQHRGEPQILFIERAASPSDPWSGQVAFPGGGLEPADRDLQAAAIRETREEVGIVLSAADQVGRLDDQEGSRRNERINLVIGCFVFRFAGDPRFAPNYEVADAFWTDVSRLKDTGNRFLYQTSYRDEPFPAIRLDKKRVLWGLTWRFVADLLDYID